MCHHMLKSYIQHVFVLLKTFLFSLDPGEFQYQKILKYSQLKGPKDPKDFIKDIIMLGGMSRDDGGWEPYTVQEQIVA